MVLVVAAGYFLAERFVFHVEYRDEAMTFSVSEVPTAFALAFLGPVPAIVARLVGSTPVLVRAAATTPRKSIFNASLFSFELGLGFVVLGAVAGPDAQEARFVVGIVAATLVTVVVGAFGVTLAIACAGGDLREALSEEARTTLVVGPIITMVGALSVIPATLDLRLMPLGLAAIWAVWFVLLRYGRLAQRHRDLRSVYDFTRSVGTSLQIDQIVATALDSSLSQLRATRGGLVVFGPDGGVIAEAHVGAPVRVDGPPPFDGSQLRVPIVDVAGTLGELRLAGRRVAAERFDDDDRHRAELLADRLASTLRNALLHANLEHAALHDPLTGELNRRGFDDRVAVELARRSDDVRAVVILDLDRFKEINDTFGHHAGDELLVEFARRVRAIVGPDDVLARFGGDEFAVFAERRDDDAVRALVEEIVARARQPFHIDRYDVVVAVSAGVSYATEDDVRGEQPLRRADIAMYAAKRTHVGYEVYREEMDRRTPERLELLGELRDALDAEALEVHFQPKIDVESRAVVGAEALVRWNHAVRGWVSPADFVVVAEESGLIRQLTDQVLRAALEAASGWRDLGWDLDVAVNLSALDLVDERLADRIARHLARVAIPADRLTLEVTESSLLVDTPRTMATVELLGALGARLSLDDFGTGYSSLSYLRRLPAHELKIDRSFVSSMLTDHQDEVIVRSTIDLGHHLGMKVVAEGIEDERTSQRLRELGCDLGQGFGISRPMDAESFERWLDDGGRPVRRIVAPRAVAPPASNVTPLRARSR